MSEIAGYTDMYPAISYGYLFLMVRLPMICLPNYIGSI